MKREEKKKKAKKKRNKQKKNTPVFKNKIPNQESFKNI